MNYAMDKILFLDVDGVLNHDSHRNWAGFNSVSKSCCEALFAIVSETGCKIVISSTWRIASYFEGNIKQCMEKSGVNSLIIDTIIGSIIGKTLDFSELDRMKEIQEWLDNNEHSSFVILDDLELDSPNLILTDDEVGLTFGQADRAIKILNQ